MTAPRTVEIVVAQPGACGSLLQAWKIGPKASLPPMSSVISRTSSIGVAVALALFDQADGPGELAGEQGCRRRPGLGDVEEVQSAPQRLSVAAGHLRCEQVVQLRDVPLGRRWLGAYARCDRVAQRQVERSRWWSSSIAGVPRSAATSAPATAARRIVRAARLRRRFAFGHASLLAREKRVSSSARERDAVAFGHREDRRHRVFDRLVHRHGAGEVGEEPPGAVAGGDRQEPSGLADDCEGGSASRPGRRPARRAPRRTTCRRPLR